MTYTKAQEKLCFVADMEGIKELDEIAKQRERSRSFLLRLAIKEFIQKNMGEKNAGTN